MVPRIKRILLGVAIGAALFSAGLWGLTKALAERDSLYAGRSLTFWLLQATNQDAAASNTAQSVIHSQIIPQLVNQMYADTNDSHLRKALVDWLNTLPGVNILYVPADGRRSHAALALGDLGPLAKSTIPALVKAFKGTDLIVRAPAAQSLGEIRSEPESIIPLLIAAIDDAQDGVPEAAITGLGFFGPQAKAALPKLIPLQKAREKEVRRAAVVAVQQISPEREERHP